MLAAEANTDLSHSRWWLPLAGLVAVGVVLARDLPLGAARDRSADPGADGHRLVGPGGRGARRLAQPDVGDARCAGDRDRDRVQRDPLGPLRERAPRRALRRRGPAADLPAHRRAVLASGVTAIAGFAVLAIAGLPLLDDIGLISVAPVLRDFGLVTVVDLLVALAGVMLVLPAAVVWAEEGFPLPSRARPGRWRPANPPREYYDH